MMYKNTIDSHTEIDSRELEKTILLGITLTNHMFDIRGKRFLKKMHTVFRLSATQALVNSIICCPIFFY